MLNNITALNNEELKNKIVKAGIGKYSKPAKLSSGKNFKEKASKIMTGTNTPASAPVESTPVAPAATTPAEPTMAQSPEVAPVPSVTEPVAQAPEVAKEIPVASAEVPATELPAPEKVLEKIEKVGISVVAESSDGSKVNSPAKKLKVNEPVRDRVKNAYKVAESVSKEEPKQETEPALTEEVQVDPEVNVAPVPPEAPEEADQSNFFLGQKINTEEVEQEEIKDEEMPVEPTETSQTEVTSEVTQEEKDEKLNQYLNSNQEAVQGNDNADDLNLDDVLKDLDDYKKASEQIFDRQSEINKLNQDLADARKMLAEKKKEAQQMLGDARKILEEQKNEITSKTQELSDVRDAIIRWTQLKEKNQSRAQEEEQSLGKVA